jgi:hypothetical protein
MGGPARLRDRRVLEQQIAALTAEIRSGVAREDVGFRRGALAALRWVTEGGAGPLTGSTSVPPVRLAAIVKELAAAEDVIYGRPSRHREYARGVEHALMWAQFATAAPPLPPPRPQPNPAPEPPKPANWPAHEAVSTRGSVRPSRPTSAGVPLARAATNQPSVDAPILSAFETR